MITHALPVPCDRILGDYTCFTMATAALAALHDSTVLELLCVRDRTRTCTLAFHAIHFS